MSGRGVSDGEEGVERLAEKLKGELVLELDEEELVEAQKGFEHALVVQLYPGRPFNRLAFADTLRKMWSLGREVEILMVSDRVTLVKCVSAREKERILEGGPWMFVDHVVMVQKWVPNLAPSEYVFDKLSLWIQMHNLPPELVGKTVAEKVAEKLGRMVAFGTGVEQSTKRKFLRVKVEMDIDRELSPGFVYNRKERDPLWISFKYERLPTLCYRCGKIGHDEKRCSEEEAMGKGRYGPWLKSEVSGFGPWEQRSRVKVCGEVGTRSRGGGYSTMEEVARGAGRREHFPRDNDGSEEKSAGKTRGLRIVPCQRDESTDYGSRFINVGRFFVEEESDERDTGSKKRKLVGPSDNLESLGRVITLADGSGHGEIFGMLRLEEGERVRVVENELRVCEECKAVGDGEDVGMELEEGGVIDLSVRSAGVARHPRPEP